MTSKSQRRKYKKAANAALPELAEVGKRQPNGQRRDRAIIPRDPRKTALEARCRIFGVAVTKTNMAALTGQHMSNQIGLVMERECSPSEIPRLWDTWQGFCGAERTYRLRYLGQSGSAKSAAIAMVPDRMETDKSYNVDMRDSDERDRDAVSNWMRWRGYLGHLTGRQQGFIHDAEMERGSDLWANGAPTATGHVTLDALKELAVVVEGRK